MRESSSHYYYKFQLLFSDIFSVIKINFRKIINIIIIIFKHRIKNIVVVVVGSISIIRKNTNIGIFIIIIETKQTINIAAIFFLIAVFREIKNIIKFSLFVVGETKRAAKPFFSNIIIYYFIIIIK